MERVLLWFEMWLHPTAYVGLNMFIMLLSLFLMFEVIRTNGWSYSTVMFNRLVIASMMYALGDLFWELFNQWENTADFTMTRFGIFTDIFFRSYYFMATVFLAYRFYEYFTGNNGKAWTGWTWHLMRSCPFIELAMLVINLFTGVFFHIDATQHNVMTDLAFLLTVPIMVVIVFFFIYSWQWSRKLSRYSEIRNKYQMQAVISGLFLLSVLSQFFWPSVPVGSIVVFLSTAYLFIDSLRTQSAIDFLTKIDNKMTLTKYYEKHRDSGQLDSCYFIMIDANRFKRINDHFGHAEGDLALCQIADALKMTAGKHGFESARYGGDEFAMITTRMDEEEVKEIVAELKNNLREINKKSGTMWRISVSCGYAVYHESFDTMDQWMADADANMYQEKEEAHKASN